MLTTTPTPGRNRYLLLASMSSNTNALGATANDGKPAFITLVYMVECRESVQRSLRSTIFSRVIEKKNIVLLHTMVLVLFCCETPNNS